MSFHSVLQITEMIVFPPLGKDFQGKKLKVSMARRKPMMGMMRGGMPMRGDRGGMMGRGGALFRCYFRSNRKLHF